MKFVSVIAIGLLSSSAMAASFDCNVPNLNPIEKVICQIPDVSLMDDQMARAYKMVAHIPEVKEDQRQFIKERNRIKSIESLRTIMTERIIELQMIAELEGIEKKPYSESQGINVSKITGSKPVVKEGTVADIIAQAKRGNELKFRGKMAYTDYRDKNAPMWMRDCAYRIVRNDVMGRWVAQARSAGLIKEFKSVEYKIETGFVNMTIDNLKANLQQSRQMCEIMAIGTMG